jgi:RpiR family transcriptional regulator, carbohydrate utilization regulator
MADSAKPRTAGPRTEKLRAVDGIVARLQTVRASLPPTGQRIADFILSHGADVVHMSVTEVAEHTSASEGSVVGLCQKIGASGFQHLKISLAQDLVRPIQFIHEDLDGQDDYATVIEKVFQSDIRAIQDTMSVLDPRAMEKAVNLILGAERVELYGVGSAAPIAEDAHYRMLRIGINCKVVIDSHVQAISASLTGPKVTTITVSHSGSTLETVTATKLAKEAGASTICITNFGRSPIHAYADVILNTMARETQFRTEAMTSRIAQLSIVDALIACLALRNYDTAVETIQQTFSVLATKRY